MGDDLRLEIDDALRGIFADVSTNLALDANGMVSIGFKDDVVVTLEVPRTGQYLYIHAPLLHLVPGDGADTAEAALSLNLFETAMPGTWIALDPEARILLLCGCLHRRLCAPRDLSETLAGFVASVSTTRDHLARRSGSPETSVPAAIGDGTIIFRS